MYDWLNKFFAIFTMYKTNRELDELEEADHLANEVSCPHCEQIFSVDTIDAELRFCPSCGRKL